MKICIVAHYAYGALTGEGSGHIGGVERQTALLSEWLVNNGHDVTVITWDEGGEKVQVVNKIKIIKLCNVEDGFPILRFFTPRWSSLVKALKQADAELYYHNCAEYVTGQVAFWAKTNNKAFIYTVASDADCEKSFPKLQTKRDRFLFLYGLKNANQIICQTYKQLELLKNNFQLDSKVIPMPSTPPQGQAIPEQQFSAKKIIWVGRIQQVKRIEWLIDIAEALPHISFEVVGPDNHNPKYTDNILPRADALKNIKFLGKISRENMPSVYKGASALLNTSFYEGFPNTFLEAWSYGVPVISTVDPDNVITNNQLGFSSSEQQQLITAIKDLLDDQNYWLQCSQNSYQYYLKNHEMEMVQKQFEKEFLKLSYNARTQQHFNEMSINWADYYNHKGSSISHLDLQVRSKFASQYLDSIQLCKENTLIDVGCGTGDATRIFQKITGAKILGVDFAEEMINHAKNLESHNINFQVADATSLPFYSESVEALVSLGTVEYIPQYQRAFSEFNRVIKGNGKLILSVPNQHSIFRKLRTFGKKIVRPIKRVFSTSNHVTEQEYHKQWKVDELFNDLEKNGFLIQNINYFSYGFLNPKLVNMRLNISLCEKLNDKLMSQSFLAKYLAHSTIVLANKIEKKSK